MGSKDAHFMVIRAGVRSERENERGESKLNVPLRGTPNDLTSPQLGPTS